MVIRQRLYLIKTKSASFAADFFCQNYMGQHTRCRSVFLLLPIPSTLENKYCKCPLCSFVTFPSCAISFSLRLLTAVVLLCMDWYGDLGSRLGLQYWGPSTQPSANAGTRLASSMCFPWNRMRAHIYTPYPSAFSMGTLVPGSHSLHLILQHPQLPNILQAFKKPI